MIQTYKHFVSPVGFDFQKMNRRESATFFDFFIKSKNERLSILHSAVVSLSGYEGWQPDYSDLSVRVLETWLHNNVRCVPTSSQVKEEIKNKHSNSAVRLVENLYSTDLTSVSYSICYDSGIYLGEALRIRCAGVEWCIGPPPKTGVLYNWPIISTADRRFQWNILYDNIESMRYYVTHGKRYDMLQFIKNLENRIVKRR